MDTIDLELGLPYLYLHYAFSSKIFQNEKKLFQNSSNWALGDEGVALP